MDKFDDATKVPSFLFPPASLTLSSRKNSLPFLESQQALAALNGKVQQLTTTCWDKCITSTPSTYFSRSEQSCLSNCVERFLDTSIFMVKHIEQQRLQQQQTQ